MRCEHCNQNEATTYIKQNINGKVTEMHLCRDCAEKLGVLEPMHSNMGLGSMFEGSFFGNFLGAGLAAMNALALTVDTSILTAVGNDYGYDTVFARQLEGVGRAGDLLVGLSTSGNSRNIVLAMELARSMGIRTAALTGRGGGAMKEQADFCIAVPSDATNNIQEMHIAVGHLVCELVEQEMYGRKALFLDLVLEVDHEQGSAFGDDIVFVPVVPEGVLKVGRG